MKRKKHIKDTKANTHWERWFRATKGWKGYIQKHIKHFDYNIEGRIEKQKLIIKIIKRKINENY